MRPEEADQVAELIFQSTNYWYEASGHSRIFQGNWQDCRLFADVYEDLDPGCCLVQVSGKDTIIGSCFYHPRETHLSLGIMNTHPAFGRKGVAKALLQTIIEIADLRSLPLRLVSSAFNLDSFSLYTRQGLAPFALYQDMAVAVPQGGFNVNPPPGIRIRPAKIEDVRAIDQLEQKVWQTSRKKDWQYFIENTRNIWCLSVAEDGEGSIVGALNSVDHPGSNCLGPGLAMDASVMASLIRAQLNKHRTISPVFVLPSNQRDLVKAMYDLGARNRELHVGQCLGNPPQISGIVMPTFIPETG